MDGGTRGCITIRRPFIELQNPSIQIAIKETGHHKTASLNAAISLPMIGSLWLLIPTPVPEVNRIGNTSSLYKPIKGHRAIGESTYVGVQWRISTSSRPCPLHWPLRRNRRF